MKKIIIIFGIILTSTNIINAQDKVMSVAYQSTENNTYKYRYYDNGDVFISNANDPFEGQSAVGPDSKVRITKVTKELYDVVYKYLGPYTTIPLRMPKDQDVFVYIKADLNGEVGYVSVAHSSTHISFPVEAYEVLETAIKNEYKLTIEYNPDNIDGVYVTHSVLLSLNDIREEQLLNDNFEQIILP